MFKKVIQFFISAVVLIYIWKDKKFIFFLPRNCFLSTLIATEYAFTSSIHYDPPRMTAAAAATAAVLHTHRIRMFRRFAHSAVQCVRFQCGGGGSSSSARTPPALYFGKTVASHIGDASPIACKLYTGPALVAKRRVCE